MAIADYIGKYWAGAEVINVWRIAMTFGSMFRGYLIVIDPILHKIVIASLACCITWGIVDGLFFYLGEELPYPAGEQDT